MNFLGNHSAKIKPPLYVIHANDVGDFDEAYDNHSNRIIKCVSHTDPAFKSYNGDVFSILVHYTENCEGISIVQSNERRRNDRKAWKQFQSHFEDNNYKRRSAQEAGSILKSASYSGLKEKFLFGNYYKLRFSAYSKLLHAQKPMTTGKDYIRSCNIVHALLQKI